VVHVGPLPEAGVREDAADVGPHGPVPRLVEPVLDGEFDVVLEFEAAAGEELDAVVGHRVVGGRDHDAEVGGPLLGQVGDRRRRLHTEVRHLDARAGESRGDRGGEELPRGPGVPADDGAGPVPLEGAGRAQDMSGGHPEVQRQLGGHVPVGQATHAVGAEQSTHPSRLPVRLVSTESSSR